MQAIFLSNIIFEIPIDTVTVPVTLNKYSVMAISLVSNSDRGYIYLPDFAVSGKSGFAIGGALNRRGVVAWTTAVTVGGLGRAEVAGKAGVVTGLTMAPAPVKSKTALGASPQVVVLCKTCLQCQ